MEKKIKLVLEEFGRSSYLYVYCNDAYVNMFIDVEIKPNGDMYAIYKNGNFITGFDYVYTTLEKKSDEND